MILYTQHLKRVFFVQWSYGSESMPKQKEVSARTLCPCTPEHLAWEQLLQLGHTSCLPSLYELSRWVITLSASAVHHQIKFIKSNQITRRPTPEHLAWDELLELGHQLLAQFVRVVSVGDHTQCISRLAIDLDLQLDQIVLTEAQPRVLHGSVALRIDR